MPRPKKKVDESVTINTSGEKWITGGSTGTGNLNIVPYAWDFPQPETRAEFIESVSRSILCNVRDWDVLKNGKTAATAAYGMAVHLADLLEKRDKGD